MDNQELEQRIHEILANENLFDLIIATKNFEPEYKKSDFYKQTKMGLDEVLKQAKIHYALQAEPMKEALQKLINGLDFSHVESLMDQIAKVYGEENAQTAQMLGELQDFKEIIKKR